ncbi:MAG: hypothetical protein PW843_03220 [Azospirillaceae bacterium]|nr:hypothetical protein [Azospirillaceae bacterium]
MPSSSIPNSPISLTVPLAATALPAPAAQVPALARSAAHAALSVRLACGRLAQGQGQAALDELVETAAPALEQTLEGIGRLEAALDAYGRTGEADLRPAATLRVRVEAAASLLKQADVLARAGLSEEAGDSREAALWTLERGLALVPPFSPIEAASGLQAMPNRPVPAGTPRSVPIRPLPSALGQGLNGA